MKKILTIVILLIHHISFSQGVSVYNTKHISLLNKDGSLINKNQVKILGTNLTDNQFLVEIEFSILNTKDSVVISNNNIIVELALTKLKPISLKTEEFVVNQNNSLFNWTYDDKNSKLLGRLKPGIKLPINNWFFVKKEVFKMSPTSFQTKINKDKNSMKITTRFLCDKINNVLCSKKKESLYLTTINVDTSENCVNNDKPINTHSKFKNSQLITQFRALSGK